MVDDHCSCFFGGEDTEESEECSNAMAISSTGTVLILVCFVTGFDLLLGEGHTVSDLALLCSLRRK